MDLRKDRTPEAQAKGGARNALSESEGPGENTDLKSVFGLGESLRFMLSVLPLRV